MKRSHKLLENDDSHVAHSVTANKRYRTLKIMTVIKLFAGFAFLYFGGELLISSGSKVALEMGVSEYVISAIFIAFGTSFPELVTAIVACVKKKEIDLIIGNVIGSNVFNAAFVLGGLGFYEVVFKHSFLMELGALLLVSILLLGLALFKKVFYRPIGIIFLALYSAMIVYWVN